jgi:hypothetical protein
MKRRHEICQNSTTWPREEGQKEQAQGANRGPESIQGDGGDKQPV